MNPLISAFNLILYQPLFNALVLLYEYLPGHDFGIAVIVLTILIKFLFYPLGVRAIRSQKALSELQPKIKEIQEKYKNDREKQAKATMELYKKEKINPFSGCLPLLIQLPILIALYRVFWRGFGAEQMIHLYSFVSPSAAISTTFLGIMDLSKSFIIKSETTGEIIKYVWPVLILAILTGVCQFIQMKMLTPKTKSQKTKGFDFSQIFQKQMIYFFPVITVWIVVSMPAAIGIYWIVTTLFSIVQQRLILKKSAIDG